MLLVLIWRWIDPDMFHSSVTNWVPLAVSSVEPSPVSDVSGWAQYGPAGLSAGIFASIAWVLFNMQRETLKIERERSARFEQEIRDLNVQFREKIVPTLTLFTSEATRLTQATTEAIQTMTRQAQARERERDR